MRDKVISSIIRLFYFGFVPGIVLATVPFTISSHLILNSSINGTLTSKMLYHLVDQLSFIEWFAVPVGAILGYLTWLKGYHDGKKSRDNT